MIPLFPGSLEGNMKDTMVTFSKLFMPEGLETTTMYIRNMPSNVVAVFIFKFVKFIWPAAVNAVTFMLPAKAKLMEGLFMNSERKIAKFIPSDGKFSVKSWRAILIFGWAPSDMLILGERNQATLTFSRRILEIAANRGIL